MENYLENDRDPWFIVDGAAGSDSGADDDENLPLAHNVSDGNVQADDTENLPLTHNISDGNVQADDNENLPLAHNVLSSHAGFDDDENPFLVHEALQDAEAKAAEAQRQQAEREAAREAAAIRTEIRQAWMWEQETWDAETRNASAANRLTAESLIEHPKRSAVVPSDNGKFGLYTVSTHEIGIGTTHDVRVMNLWNRVSTSITTDPAAHDACWIPGTTRVLYLKSTSEGKTEVWIAPNRTIIAEYDTKLNNLQLKELPNGTIVFMAAGLAGEDGKPCRQGPETARRESRLIGPYNLRRKERRTLFYSVLCRTEEDSYAISTVLHNLILSNTMEAPLGACQAGFTSLVDNFAIGPRGVAVIALEHWVASRQCPDVSHPYFVDIEVYNKPPASRPRPITVPYVFPVARASCMRQSPDGSMIGFLFQQGEGLDDHDLEARRVWLASLDKKHLVAYPLIHRPEDDLPDDQGTPLQRFDFAGDNQTFIFLSEWQGRVGLSRVVQPRIEPRYNVSEEGTTTAYHPLVAGDERQLLASRYKLFAQGTTTAYHPLVAGDWSRLLVSRSNLLDSSIWDVVDVADGAVQPLSSATSTGRLFGVHRDSIVAGGLSFHAAGSDVMQQAMIMYETRRVRKANKKTLPWIMALHGSATGSWTDGWKQQFNALAWVQRGFVVILPNLSGSTGYGRSFRNDARKARGQRPVHDLIVLIQQMVNEMECLDPKRGILYAAGHAVHTACLLSRHETINHFCGTILHDPIPEAPAWTMSPRFGYCEFSYFNSLKKFNEDSADMGSICDERVINLDRAERLPGPQTLVTSVNYARSTSTMMAALFPPPEDLPPARPLFEGREVAGHNESDLLWYRRAFDFAEHCTTTVQE